MADQEIQFTDLRRQALQTLRDREQASKRESERLAQKARSLAAQWSDLD
ncbi:MAG: hypothetical protein GWM98_05725, partial [Nitrospinaceae bacterium]|nr:hypothetical protein [Nitrospinaceae bacterium]NIR54059.1 hypothetical protein [Nitrospinaceae bacterium]NIS84476.1 hypothetical protein [Nitrospinaceae bacterium]NIT81272.1 hypothetical protein [Nitrospinaceae bacterium]NIU43559.1 hypothetical protein [Nitrospinaceae bacterium]